VNWLEDEGFAVQAAQDGRQALEMIEFESPDLIVLDLMMPNVTGWDVLAHLESRPLLKAIPTLVITAAGNVGRAPITRPLFVKPLKMDALVRAIRTLTSPTAA
jgi:CheY-like chemotaxis protein